MMMSSSVCSAGGVRRKSQVFGKCSTINVGLQFPAECYDILIYLPCSNEGHKLMIPMYKTVGLCSGAGFFKHCVLKNQSN